MVAVAKKMKAVVAKEVVPMGVYCTLSILERVFKKPREKMKDNVAEVVSKLKPYKDDTWYVQKVETPFKGLDTERIKSEMSADWLKKYEKSGTRVEYKVQCLTGADLPLKDLEMTPELCDDVMSLLARHAKRQHNSKGK